MIDKQLHYEDSSKLGIGIRIKLYRRLLASLSAICARKLSKETLKPDSFVKFLENGNYCLEQFHQQLVQLTLKTNQKLQAASPLLEDLSVSSSEDVSRTPSRSHSKRITKNENSILNKKGTTQKKPILLSSNKTESRDRQLDQIPDISINETEPVHNGGEELMPEDIDSNDWISSISIVNWIILVEFSQLPLRRIPMLFFDPHDALGIIP